MGLRSWHLAGDQLLPDGVRFFARLVSFDISCPACGETRFCHRTVKPHDGWDARLSRWQCPNPNCKKIYTLGIVAWPGNDRTLPPDQSPDRMQGHALRAFGVSVPTHERKRMDGANVLVEQEIGESGEGEGEGSVKGSE